MRLFNINDKKRFMNLLLAKDVFDSFFLVECTIRKYVTYSIDGRKYPEFLPDSDKEGDETRYIRWGQIRPECLELIRGKNTPLFMKFILSKEPGAIAEPSVCTGVSDLLLNISFSDNTLTLTTAVNFSGFYPDSEMPALWDDHVEKLLNIEQFNILSERSQLNILQQSCK